MSNNKIGKAYDKAINIRVPIMLGLTALALLIFISVLSFITYTNNVVDPFNDTENIKYVSLDYLNENKFTILEDDFYLKSFYLEDTDDNAVEDGKIELTLKIGKQIDQNITSTSISMRTYITYNWMQDEWGDNKYLSSSSTTSTFSSGSSKPFSISNIDATFNKRPYFFVSIDLRKDIRFLTSFTFKEIINGEEIEMTYVVEQSFNDLYHEDMSFSK